jgi:hypothetical protein
MESIFSAPEPNLGYIYQVRYGLMQLLTHHADEARLLIEQIDDVSIDLDDFLNVYQTKLHIKSVANLTDTSPDFWKTVRVWSEGIKSGSLVPELCIFNLITTAKASPRSVCYDLRIDSIDDRDVDEIRETLRDIARSSGTEANAEAYESFLGLTQAQQDALIEGISINDGSVDLEGARERCLRELRFTSLDVVPLYERVEGWFLNQVILQLQNKRGGITHRELKDRILSISDSLKVDNLPNDFASTIISDKEKLQGYQQFVFVKQLELVDANSKIVNHAISDYHRAFSQKSKWLRDGLIDSLDEIEYHEKLKEDWDRKFALIADSPLLDDEQEQKRKGLSFYQNYYIERCPQIYIRQRFSEQYMVTGCCHGLSNLKQIGWHPDFDNLI